MRFYGAHGVAKETLASGAPIPDGDFFEMSQEDANDSHNKRLLEEGKIIGPVSSADMKKVEKGAELAEAEQRQANADANADNEENGGE